MEGSQSAQMDETARVNDAKKIALQALQDIVADAAIDPQVRVTAASLLLSYKGE